MPAAIVEGLGERYAFLELADARNADGRAALPAPLRELVDRVERLPAIAELVAATR